MSEPRGKAANAIICDDYQYVGCDEICPANLYGEAANYYQNLGCLPSPYEISEMLAKKQVWMCHSNPEKPCVYTKLKEVPADYVPRTSY
jgi:hypothetical protein